MLPNDLSVTIDTVDYNLKKIVEQGGISQYRGSYDLVGGEKRDMVLEVKHTIPNKAESKSSSLCKLTIHRYNAEGVFQNTSTAWTVVTLSNGHNSVSNDFAETLLKTFMNKASFRDEWMAGAY